MTSWPDGLAVWFFLRIFELEYKIWERSWVQFPVGPFFFLLLIVKSCSQTRSGGCLQLLGAGHLFWKVSHDTAAKSTQPPAVITSTPLLHISITIITIRYLHGLRYAIQFIVRAFFSLTEQPMRRDVIFNLKLTPTCQCSPHRSINETIEWNHNTTISRYRIIHGDGVLSLKIDCGWDQTMTRTRRRQFWFVTKFRASEDNYSIRSSFFFHSDYRQLIPFGSLLDSLVFDGVLSAREEASCQCVF